MRKNSINKDMILSQTTHTQIILHFLGLSELPKGNISSPFSQDSSPSFKIYPNTETFHCFSTGKHGDGFNLVANLNDLDYKSQFNEVLQIIHKEMNLLNQSPNGENVKRVIKKSSDLEIQFTIDKVLKIDFKNHHLEFWEKLGVKKDILKRFNVSAITSYSFYSNNMNKQVSINIKENELAFCYEINGRYEVYIPQQPSRKKTFCNGLFADDIFGFEQLKNSETDNLIICAGKKDALVAISRNFNAVSFRSETHTLTNTQIKKLQSLCNQLFICYDNDPGGEAGIKKVLEKFPEIKQLKLPSIYNDLTDYFMENSNSDFKKIIDSAIPKNITPQESYNDYLLPKEVEGPIEKYITDIQKYKLFMENNKIWILRWKSGNYHFESVSNFKIEIIQHMKDEKNALKLIRIINIFNHENIFDALSDRLNTPMKFDDIITTYGNYQWYGNQKDFQLLRAFLFDKMGNGKKIDCLGWQKDNDFWVWNNRVNLCNGSYIEIDSNGIFHHNETSFYIPSANKIYKNNAFKYEPQKNFTLLQSSISIETYLLKMLAVHRNHSITAMLFTISSFFQDIIIDEIKGFPILFLQGKASSGKDQLSLCCQSFYGKPQASINVEAGVSTAKAHIREFAQFSNGICQFSEYKNGDKQLDGILKGIWDRNGYKRGTIDSSVATESVPILSSLILTSNYFPDDEPLITRLLWLDMNKNEFTAEEINSYNELSDITTKGISSYGDEIIKHRQLFQTNFKVKYRNSKEYLSGLIPTSPSRISTNYAILMATYEIISTKIHFPFTYNEMLQHFTKSIEFQLNKISSSSISNKWWDCFLIVIQVTNDNRLEINTDIKVEENKLHFNFTNTYNKIQRQWYNQYRETIPTKTVIQEILKKDKSFIDVKSSYRFSTGKNGTNTSAYVVNINLIGASNEIKNTIETLTSNIS